MKEAFIGPNKVSGVVILDYKTPKGAEVVKILYENPIIPFEIMPKVTFERVVSSEAKDWNYVREKRGEGLLEELAAVCMEHDVVYGDVAHIAHNLQAKLKTAFDRATNFLWTKDDKQFIDGRPSPIDLRSLLEAEQVLKGIPPEVSVPVEPTNEQGK